jgi:hypothetical protein
MHCFREVQMTLIYGEIPQWKELLEIYITEIMKDIFSWVIKQHIQAMLQRFRISTEAMVDYANDRSCSRNTPRKF